MKVLMMIAIISVIIGGLATVIIYAFIKIQETNNTNMKPIDIARKNNVTRGYVSSVLAGKSNSMSEKAIQIIIDAADAHAERQKTKFIADVMYRFKLAQTRKMNIKKKKNEKNDNRVTLRRRHRK